jgi:hypothetical protein
LLLPETVEASRPLQQPDHQLCTSDTPSRRATPIADSAREMNGDPWVVDARRSSGSASPTAS